MQDEVDALISAWGRERPDLATEPMAIWSRIKRLDQHLDASRRHAYAEHGIDVHEFDVLAALRRGGAPYRLSPGQLVAATHVTSGTMTHRIDRLVSRGFVERESHPDDGRAVLVRLTEQGRGVVDAALSSLLAAEEALLGSLSTDARERLADDLRTLLVLQD
ncbi:MarR family winged helix-turn-helix transcriptional regulator [Aestuariimicrobium sp. T2.26MG-19.2B]|uniref:MarR family winged helix-turn-helix transcriptional regulator n=1 Tax=Aestuariimicrobium sp. T2.26MG-19.2B TaxID=3040679 RepID=UPI002540386D|nr:MarR family transcriptional regulator [Aestuariimicrobium sp. T2.26MG-19.2B]